VPSLWRGPYLIKDSKRMEKKPKARSYDDKDLKLLWGLAAARCGFGLPKCRVECVAQATKLDRAAVLGQMGHIIAHGRTGPRADPTYPKELLNKYENLILLCGHHHPQVDGQASTYTVVDLRGWKSEHEQWVRASLAQEIPSVGFAELEVVARGLLSQPMRPVDNMTLTPPAQKMERNLLTENSHFLLSIGLSKAREVEEYVSHVSLIDPEFPERLKKGFREQYEKFLKEGSAGDELFALLHQYASGYSYDFKRQSAGLAVLTYLFEKCEVFEP
jgi:hypothetical protein